MNLEMASATQMTPSGVRLENQMNESSLPRPRHAALRPGSSVNTTALKMRSWSTSDWYLLG